eukprot:TRINITY_DN270_c0_g2_i1.p1 TRINITY_DN270_c0_g2~~TRINITY_DN270_c0_g2_i1.p1  ORF type:complete len:286 (-),score=46.37 TRINITY_DN270_c0_g2_i1:130-987(-)
MEKSKEEIKYPLETLNIPFVAAHRGGGSTFGPENLIYTIKKSVEVGSPVLEIDVIRTQDGVLVLSHDDKTWFGRISRMTYDELLNIDAAYQWSPDNGVTYPLRGQGYVIPTLEEVLDLYHDSDIIFYLDLKSRDIAVQVLTMVQHKNLEHRVIFGAVDGYINQELLEVKPHKIPSTPSVAETFKILTYWSLPGGRNSLKNYLAEFPHQIIGFPYGHFGCQSLMSKDFVDAVHEEGKYVMVFGPALDDPIVQQSAWSIGVDAIFTDRPDIAIPLLKEIKKQSKEEK